MKTLLKTALAPARRAPRPSPLLVATLRVGPAPAVELRADAKAIGARTARRGRGVGRRAAASPGLRVEVEQAGRTHVVAQRGRTARSPPWAFCGRARARRTSCASRSAAAPSPTSRRARPSCASSPSAPPTWLRHPDPVVKELRLPVRLIPPSLALLSSQHYVAQGGSGVVVYRVGATAVARRRARRRLVLPGLAAAGRSGKEDRLALFGVPWDLADDGAGSALVAEDDAGNAAELAFVDRFFPKPPARDTHRARRRLPREGRDRDPAADAGARGPREPPRQLPRRSTATCARRTPRSSSRSPRARRAPSSGPSPSCRSATPR